MSCDRTPELDRLLNGKLPDPEALALEDHLADCPACQCSWADLTAASQKKWIQWQQLIDTRGESPPDTDATCGKHAALNQPGATIRKSAAMDSFPPVPGYQIIQEIGRGGMGVVYLARHDELDRCVAIKMLLHGALSGPERLARFRTEARTIARLNHPNIIHIYEIGDSQSIPYIVLEYVDGPNLANAMAGQPQPIRATVSIMITLATAVAEAHRAGIVHRDIKPANVLLDVTQVSDPVGQINLFHKQWRRIQPKLSDFGLAKQDGDSAGTRSGEMLGTPHYMAPEILRGAETSSASADVYALGAMMHEMLSGNPPFPGSNLMTILQQAQHQEPPAIIHSSKPLPRDLDTIIRKCLAKDPSNRYAQAQSLAEDLRRFQDGRPILARRVPAWERAWRWARRHPALAAAGAVCIVVTTALLIMWAQFTRNLALANEATGREARRAKNQAELAARNQAEAEKNLHQARDAARRYLKEVLSDSRLDSSDLVSLRLSLLEEATQVYSAMLTDSTDSNLRRELAAVHFEMGRLANQIDDTSMAQQHYELAGQLMEQLLEAHPDQPQAASMRLFQAGIWQSLATVFDNQGDREAATRGFARAQQAYESAATVDPVNVQLRWHMTGNLQRIAQLQWGNEQRPLAMQTLEEAIQVGDQLPHVPDYLWFAIKGHAILARWLETDGQLDPAEHEFRIVEAVGRRLMLTAPLPRYKSTYVACLRNLARLEAARGDREASQRWLATAIRIRERMAANAPDNDGYRNTLVSTYRQMGATWHEVDPAIAEEWQHRMEAVLAGNVPTTDWDIALQTAEHLIGEGMAALRNFDLDDAKAYLQKAIRTIESAQGPSDDWEQQRLLVLAHSGLARTQTFLEEHDQSLEHWHLAGTSFDNAPMPNVLRVYFALSLVNAGQVDKAVQRAENISTEWLWPESIEPGGGIRPWRSHLRLGVDDVARLAQVYAIAARVGFENGRDVVTCHSWIRRSCELVDLLGESGTQNHFASRRERAIYYSQLAHVKHLIPEGASSIAPGNLEAESNKLLERLMPIMPSLEKRLEYSPEFEMIRRYRAGQ